MAIEDTINQAIADFDRIEKAIEDCGVDVPFGTDTKDYGDKIKEVCEQGKKSQYDEFWDAYQLNGNRTDYSYAFCDEGWNDTTYNPKYPIVATNINRLFYSNEQITNTKVPIIMVGANIYGDEKYMHIPFADCSSLKTIPSLSVSKEAAINNSQLLDFQNCDNIEHIGFNDEVWCDVWLQYSDNIDDETLIQLVHCLKDFSKSDELNEEYGGNFYIYISSKCVDRLTVLKMDDRDPYYKGETLETVILTKMWGY